MKLPQIILILIIYILNILSYSELKCIFKLISAFKLTFVTNALKKPNVNNNNNNNYKHPAAIIIRAGRRKFLTNPCSVNTHAW